MRDVRFELSAEEYEQLDQLRSRPGMNVLRRMLFDAREQLIRKSFEARTETVTVKNKDRDISTTISVESRLKMYAGIAEGMSVILEEIDGAGRKAAEMARSRKGPAS